MPSKKVALEVVEPEKKKPVKFERGQIIAISPSDADGIFLKDLPNGNARVVCGRNRIEVVEMATLRKLNA